MKALHEREEAVVVIVVVLNKLGEEAHDPRNEEHVQRYLNLLLRHLVLDVFGVAVVQEQTCLVEHYEELKNERRVSEGYKR